MTETEETTKVEEIKAEAPPVEVIDNMLKSFDTSWDTPEEKKEEKAEVKTEAEPKKEEKPKEKTTLKEATQGNPTGKKEITQEEENEEEAEETTTGDSEFDEILNTELKRFDKKMTLKQYLKEHPEDVKEVLQKKWDYEERRESLKVEKAQIEEEKQSIETVILRNMFYETGMQLKTLDDFKNDIRHDDPEEAYAGYLKEVQKKAEPLVRLKNKAEADNAEMMEDFAEEFKDIPVKEILQTIRPYLNASVSMGHTPFPKDALKVFYLGKNFDKLVKDATDEARKDERKKVVKEWKKDGTVKLDNMPPSSKTKETVRDKTELPAQVRDFEDAWKV